jgi:hypothetical protein
MGSGSLRGRLQFNSWTLPLIYTWPLTYGPEATPSREEKRLIS